MAVFIMFGKYTHKGLEEISSDRTTKASELIENCNGEIKSTYAMLGDQDLLIIADFPNIDDAIKASASLSRMTNISFTTSAAVPVAEFDRIMSGS